MYTKSYELQTSMMSVLANQIICMRQERQIYALKLMQTFLERELYLYLKKKKNSNCYCNLRKKRKIANCLRCEAGTLRKAILFSQVA